MSFSDFEYSNTPAAEEKEAAVRYVSDEPIAIMEKLNRYVIGQERAKRTMCIAAYTHYARLDMHDPDVKKANILLIGPTGCGKTHIVSSLAKTLDVPFVTISATSLTASGFVGQSVESCLATLLQKTKNASGGVDVKKAERGIVFIDEIDKIRKNSTNNTSGVDIVGERVQQELLTLIEGADFLVNVGNYSKSETYMVNTGNILFILGGAFPALADIICRRVDPNGNVGYTETELLHKVQGADLETFGFIPEFIGRIPVISIVNQLTTEDYCRILTEPKDALCRQFCKLFRHMGTELYFEQEVLEFIAEECSAQRRGARGLRGIMERYLQDAMYIAPSIAEFKPSFVLKLDASVNGNVPFVGMSCEESEKLDEMKEFVNSHAGTGCGFRFSPVLNRSKYISFDEEGKRLDDEQF